MKYYIMSALIGTPAWIWLFIQDWKIALTILVAMWANNLWIMEKIKDD